MTFAVRRLLVICAAMVACGTVAATLPAGATAPAPHEAASSASGLHPKKPAHAGSRYLALGDSVPFGFREATNTPTPDYTKPDTFVGYPEDVAADLSLNLTNAACPGETTASFIDVTAPSNGCEPPGYRSLFPLHVAYSGSQFDFAIQFLRRHPQTRLVSLMIGANDGFLCQKQTADHCTSEFPALLERVGRNVATILDRIRHTARYHGQIVIVNYYSLDYTDPVDTLQSQGLNRAVDGAAQPFDVEIADGFGAFRQAAAQAGGHTCAAGLLTTLGAGGCGVHPSVAGQAVLAGAAERVVRKRG
jgi:lysophospholipase L1-like esterase